MGAEDCPTWTERQVDEKNQAKQKQKEKN